VAKRKRKEQADHGHCELCWLNQWTVELLLEVTATKRPVPDRVWLCPECYEESEALSEAFLNKDGSWKSAT